jgi:hypothetical protein
VNELRDPIAYRIAIGSLGLGLAAVIAGISWVAVVQESAGVPVGLWFVAAALGGVFIGVLIPFSVYLESSCAHASGCCSARRVAWGSIFCVAVVAAVGIAATTVGLAKPMLELDALGAVTAGVLLGLPVPSPGRRDPRGQP